VEVAVAAAQGEPREFYCGAGKLAESIRERNAGRRSWGDELMVLAFAVDRQGRSSFASWGGGFQSFDPGRGADGGG
jgi:hypothetical protein